MAKRSDTDKAIRNIMNWAERPEWSGERSAVFQAHITPVCERISISENELAQELEEHGYAGMLFGIMFEDFLSRRLPPNNNNIVDDYLKRRGWRESVPGRRYLQQVRDSVLSLYEVVAISPGQHCDLADLVRGEKTVRVYERLGTKGIVKWDRIAARVLDTRGKHAFSGGILPFSPEASQSVLRVLTKSRKQFDRVLSKALDKDSVAKMSSQENLHDMFLRDTCTVFTSIWLIHTLEQLKAPLPELVNRDGDSLLFSETHFPIRDEKNADIAARLDAAPDWESDGTGSDAWIWLPEPEGFSKKPRGSKSFKASYEGQRPISGTLELKSDVLILHSNSMERTERGTGVLQLLLGNLIGPALSKLQTIEQLMTDGTQQHSNRNVEPTNTIDPEIAAEIVQVTLDQHYRQSLDEPIPALGNKTPRQCARSKAGRKKVIEWLKQLENNELRRAADQGQEPYDSSWMWDELKLT